MQSLQSLKKPKALSILAFIIILFFAPTFFSGKSYSILLLNYLCIYTIAATGLDILLGCSGQNSLGQAGFYAIGAYTSAILSKDLGVPVILSMLCGIVLATIVAILLAIPASRLVHHFLALTTIAFGEMIRSLLVTSPGNITRGYQGLTGIPNISLFGYQLKGNTKFFYFALIVALLAMLVKYRIVNSRIGRTLYAIREDKVAANGMGINVSKYRVMAFAIAGAFTSLAGAMYAHLVNFISPETFSYDTSVMFLTMVLFGGLGTYLGPVVGAGIVIVVFELLQSFGEYQMLVYGAFILIVLMFMPNGVMGLITGIIERQKAKIKRKESSNA